LATEFSTTAAAAAALLRHGEEQRADLNPARAHNTSCSPADGKTNWPLPVPGLPFAILIQLTSLVALQPQVSPVTTLRMLSLAADPRVALVAESVRYPAIHLR